MSKIFFLLLLSTNFLFSRELNVSNTMMISAMMIVTVFVAYMPFLIYFKEANTMRQTGKSWVEICLKAFFYQFGLVLFLIILCTAVDYALTSANTELYDYSPGMAIYNLTEGSIKDLSVFQFWENLVSNNQGVLSSSGAGVTGGTYLGKSIYFCMVAIMLGAIFIIFLGFIMFYMCVIFPIVYTLRAPSMGQAEQGVMMKWLKCGAMGVTFYLLFFLHMSLASTFINAVKYGMGTDFEFSLITDIVYSFRYFIFGV